VVDNDLLFVGVKLIIKFEVGLNDRPEDVSEVAADRKVKEELK
jgi:hypothetical protein